MMNRKGADVKVVLTLIISVIILVLIFMGIKGCFSGGQCSSLGTIIPGFNQGTPDKVVGVQRVGFNPLTDKVYFYDNGGKFRELTKEVFLDEKAVSPDIKKTFENYFDAPREVSAPAGFSFNMHGSLVASTKFLVWAISSTAIYNFVDITYQGKNYYLVYDKLLYERVGDSIWVKSGVSQDNSIINPAVAWRDSILKGNANAQAMSVTYTDTNIQQSQTKNYCVEKKDSYLVVYLDSPVDSDKAKADKECQTK